MKSNFMLIAIFVVIIWMLSGAIWYMRSLFAVPVIELSEQEQINKYYAEELIKSEMHYFAMWEYVEGLSEQEYADVFFKVQHDK